ncbi:MAG: hypothetical protein AB8W37_12640 [Arsenophonus endosymbiont of Dermacentor nuttalli]
MRFFKSAVWQEIFSSANNNVDQNKIDKGKISEIAKACVEIAMYTNIAGICDNLK